MSYPITYNGIEGQAGLYARVQRLLDGKWWDAVGAAWVATATADCNLTLTESETVSGSYSAFPVPTFTPAPEGFYAISVFTADDVLLITAQIQNRGLAPTALELINRVQRRLRLSVFTDLTSNAAQKMLSFLNQVVIDFLAESSLWEELKLEGQLNLLAGQDLHLLSPPNVGGFDLLTNFQIGTNDPLIRLGDEDFKAYQGQYGGTPGCPVCYRMRGRLQSWFLVEVSPPPDIDYLADFRLNQKPVPLVNATDRSLLDADTIFAGMLMLARQERGEDYSAEMTMFQAKLNLQIGNEAVPEWGDVEPV